MKTLKFRARLVPKILNGEKTSTWRLFDDKDLRVGDHLEFVEYGTGKNFAEAEVTGVEIKKLGNIWQEWYESAERAVEHYKKYYGDKVTVETPVKIVEFKLVKRL